MNVFPKILQFLRALFHAKHITYDTSWLFEDKPQHKMLRDLFPQLHGYFQASDGTHIFNRADFRRVRRCRRGVRPRL